MTPLEVPQGQDICTSPLSPHIQAHPGSEWEWEEKEFSEGEGKDLEEGQEFPGEGEKEFPEGEEERGFPQEQEWKEERLEWLYLLHRYTDYLPSDIHLEQIL